MKKQIFIAGALMAALSLSVASCGDDDAPVVKVPAEEEATAEGEYALLARIVAGDEDATLVRSEIALYNMDGLTAGEWESVSLEDMVGFSAVTPSVITLHAGKSWHEVAPFSESMGPSRFGMALAVLSAAHGKDYKAYTPAPAVLDVDASTLQLGVATFPLSAVSAQELTLEYVSSYSGGRTPETGGSHKEVSVYTFAATGTFDKADALRFDTTIEAYDWLISEFSNTFGDRVNLNDYFWQWVILDNPYFYLTDLLHERDALK